MKANIIAFYRKHDLFSRYLITNLRRLKQVLRLYASNKSYFGRRVLDVACGGGVLGFILEPEGRTYTGVDINPDMISSAKSHARKVGSRNRFIRGDVTKMRIEGKFETICMLGNALCHFSTHDFAKILRNTDACTKRGAYFIVDYRDMVRLMFNKKWNIKKRLVEKERGRISTTKSCDTTTGFVLLTTTNLHGDNEVGFAHAIWSPFIIERIMNDYNWSVVKRAYSKRWAGWLDVYRRN